MLYKNCFSGIFCVWYVTVGNEMTISKFNRICRFDRNLLSPVSEVREVDVERQVGHQAEEKRLEVGVHLKRFIRWDVR